MRQLSVRLHHSLIFSWFICLLGALFYTYEYLLRIEPGIMVHDLRVYFSLSAGGIGLLASAYYWAYTPLQLVVGIILDRFGSRATLLSALSACIIGTFIFGFTKNFWIAGSGRFLIGVGSAFAFVGALKLCADWLPRKYFSFFAGLCTSLGMLGAMFGETAMSWVVDHLGWHPVIMDSLWLGIILLAIFFFTVFDKPTVVTDSNNATQKPSVSESATTDSNNATQKPSVSESAVLMRNVLKIISSKTMLQVGFIGCALYLSLSVLAEQWGNNYIQKIAGINAEKSSFYVDMIFFGWLIGSPLFGMLSEKLKSRRRVLIGGCFLSLITILPFVFCPQLLSNAMLAGLLFLFGFFCSAEINCFAVAHDLFETRLTATAAGLMNAFIMVGGMILQPFFAFCLDFFARQFHPIRSLLFYSAGDYQKALWIVPIFLLIALWLSFFVRESYNSANGSESASDRETCS